MVKILGDVHGNYAAMFLELAKGNLDYTHILQLGDLGFDYRQLSFFRKPNRPKFRFIPGNHDNYDTCLELKECLGGFGPISFIPNSFFMRGGFSIDVASRTPGISWWDKEELSWPNLESAYESYCRIKPKYMFSHECPLSLVPKITDGRIAIAYGFPPVIETRTAVTLERMLKVHRPKFWAFGHFHKDFDETIDGTRFICLCTDGRKMKNTHFDLEIA